MIWKLGRKRQARAPRHATPDRRQGGTAGEREPLFLGQNQKTGVPCIFSGEGSLLTVGPPGTGKSRGVAVWNLLSCQSSMLVTDPKGELAGWTARHRESKLGHDVAVLDPFGVSGWPCASVNPLAAVADAVRAGEDFREEADRIAHMLLPDRESDKDPYWRENARKLLVAGMLYLAVMRPGECHLPGLHGVLWQSESAFLETVVRAMQKSEALGGALAQYGNDLQDLAGKRETAFGYFREEARQALSIFAPDASCGRVCLPSKLDLSKLLHEKMTIYLVLPLERVESHGRWMGLVTSHAIHAISAAREEGECLFLLDEFPNLGRLPGIKAAIAQLRGKGLRVWMFIQELSQLESVYGKSDADNLRYQAEVLQVLGCRSRELADYIEARAGIYVARDTSYALANPLDPMDVPKATVSDIELPHIRASDALNMGRFEQILIRPGYPVVWADVKLWPGW